MADDEEVNFRVCAVLPAAGSGLRTGLETPKQFNLVLGRPLISYTLEAFERVSWIQKIVVSVSKESLQEMKNIVLEFNHNKVQITLGGATRHRSIFNGVKELTLGHNQPPDVVIIHDAVRPFVDESILKEVTLAANKHGASGAVRPLVSTVIGVDKEGFLDHSLERSKYRASEMPQAFRFDAIFNAYNKCTEYDFEYGTECLHLAQTYSGAKVKLVDGPDSLWKVTFKKDLFAAEAVLKEMTTLKAILIGSKCLQLEEDLMSKLQSKQVEVKCISYEEVEAACTQTFNVVVAVYRHESQPDTNMCLVGHKYCMIEVKHSFEEQLLNRFEDIIAMQIKTAMAEVQKNKPISSQVFSNNIFHYLSSSGLHKKTAVIVELSSNQNYIQSFKEKLKMLNQTAKSSGIQCFGIFVDMSCISRQGRLSSSECQGIVSMIVDVALNTSDTLNGQVFEYLW